MTPCGTHRSALGDGYSFLCNVLRECVSRETQATARARWESMRREAEILMKASEVSGKPSWSRARRRQRVIQPKVRSTTQRLGWTWKPPLDGLVFGLGSIVLASGAVPNPCTVCTFQP